MFWGELPMRGAILHDRGRGGAGVSGGAPAARGCKIEGGRELFLGELPLRGAARLVEGKACFWGAPAARGCMIEGGRGLFLGELPLRWAAYKIGGVREKRVSGGLPLREAA